jgi:hypothetical protein
MRLRQFLITNADTAATVAAAVAINLPRRGLVRVHTRRLRWFLEDLLLRDMRSR